MKIRLEREKETSFKEHQIQSIEYQKKLQEQLQEASRKVTLYYCVINLITDFYFFCSNICLFDWLFS